MRTPLEQGRREGALHCPDSRWGLGFRATLLGTSSTTNIVFKTSSVEAIRTMVASGMGVTILSDLIYRPWSLEGDRIETRDITEGVPTVDVSISSAANDKLSAPARTLSTFDRAATGSILVANITRQRHAARQGASAIARSQFDGLSVPVGVLRQDALCTSASPKCQLAHASCGSFRRSRSWPVDGFPLRPKSRSLSGGKVWHPVGPWWRN